MHKASLSKGRPGPDLQREGVSFPCFSPGIYIFFSGKMNIFSLHSSHPALLLRSYSNDGPSPQSINLEKGVLWCYSQQPEHPAALPKSLSNDSFVQLNAC
jgi:hypothetical protein